MATAPATTQTQVDPFAGMKFSNGQTGGVLINGNWLPADHPMALQGSGAAPPTQGPAPPTAPPTSPQPNAPNNQQATQPTIQQTFQNQLQSILAGPTADQAGMNVEGTPQAVAFRNAQQRSYEQQAQQLAEENAAAGSQANNPGLDMALRGVRQQQGEQSGAFMANLSDQRIADRRGELQNAMAMAAALGDSTAARTLQMQIAQLDADTRNRATDVNKDLGMGDLDVRRMLGLADIDLRRYGIDTSADTDRMGLGLEAERIRQMGDQSSIDAILRSMGL